MSPAEWWGTAVIAALWGLLILALWWRDREDRLTSGHWHVREDPACVLFRQPRTRRGWDRLARRWARNRGRECPRCCP